MAEEIAFEYGRISKFQGLVTLTLTLDRVMLHTVVHHSLTSTYMPNFIEMKKLLWTNRRTYVRTDERTFETHFVRSTQKSRPKNRVAEKKRSGLEMALIIKTSIDDKGNHLDCVSVTLRRISVVTVYNASNASYRLYQRCTVPRYSR